ncbi:MAG: hypothetical protein A2283_19055 [Lentisphaerae bacterium RIFOXYA12_FULL_48_11]|nr:MAG: hypothetical protein A2328_03625 [Bdellovibrionales bacterium RIFOXYB2_FULL_36_6]OGV70411.1 MAG: hypothetical protein A2283_19055 [Lentisphaerae bacterium RIFOXYA12_FULL_48_11]
MLSKNNNIKTTIYGAFHILVFNLLLQDVVVKVKSGPAGRILIKTYLDRNMFHEGISNFFSELYISK